MKVIYIIRNLLNNKKYIGSTNNFKNRKNKHLRELKKGNHHSLSLQSSWNKNKEENYAFEILEELSEEINMYQREQYYLDLYKTYDKKYGYNMAKNAIAPYATNKLIKTVYQFSMSGKLLNTFNNCVEAGKISNIDNSGISKCARENYRFYGGFIWSYEEKLSEERIKKANNPIKRSKETIDKIKYKRSLYNNKKAIIQYDMNMNFIGEWESASFASKQLNISNGGIVDVLKNRKNSIKGFKFQYKIDYKKSK